MKIVEPSFELSTPFGPLTPEVGVQMLRFVEKQARISHRSEDKQTEDSWERFIKAVVLEHGDWSVVEHASLTATLRVDRGVTHELVRHRLFSFTQESTRFVRYKQDLEFIYPADMLRDDRTVAAMDVYDWHWRAAMESAETEYFSLIDKGLRPQEARSVLPNALASTIAVTGNLRTWRWLFLARTTRETHSDFKRITIPLLEKFKQIIPLLYDDVEPSQKQSVSMSKTH